MHESSLIKTYFGIDRLQYFLITFGVGIVSGFANVITGDPNSQLASIVAVIGMFAILVANLLRLANIGMSQWWALLMFVPFANIWLGFRCQTAQRAWVETRRLDRTGKIIAIIYIVFMIVAATCLGLLLYLDPQALNLPISMP